MQNTAYNELSDIQSDLTNADLEKKLDEAITKVESERNYNSDIYEAWLSSSKHAGS